MAARRVRFQDEARNGSVGDPVGGSEVTSSTPTMEILPAQPVVQEYGPGWWRQAAPPPHGDWFQEWSRLVPTCVNQGVLRWDNRGPLAVAFFNACDVALRGLDLESPAGKVAWGSFHGKCVDELVRVHKLPAPLMQNRIYTKLSDWKRGRAYAHSTTYAPPTPELGLHPPTK